MDFIADWVDNEIDELRKIAYHSDEMILDYQQELAKLSWVVNVKLKYVTNQWYFIEITNKDIETFETNLASSTISRKVQCSKEKYFEMMTEIFKRIFGFYARESTVCQRLISKKRIWDIGRNQKYNLNNDKRDLRICKYRSLVWFVHFSCYFCEWKQPCKSWIYRFRRIENQELKAFGDRKIFG